MQKLGQPTYILGVYRREPDAPAELGIKSIKLTTDPRFDNAIAPDAVRQLERMSDLRDRVQARLGELLG